MGVLGLGLGSLVGGFGVWACGWRLLLTMGWHDGMMG